MNIEKSKPKAPTATCPECGAPSFKVGYLCVACSRPMPNSTYLERQREGLDRYGPDMDGAHAAFTAATRRHLGGR